MSLSREARAVARSLIERRLGLDFDGQREDDLERRLLQACHSMRVDPAEYVSRLSKVPDDSPEWQRAVRHLTIGETYFFRDSGCFEALEHEVLPPLIERRRREGARRLRIWSAGCSSGEEPYSLAMLLDRLVPDRSNWSITVLATDVNPHTLATARRGLYREWSFRGTPASIRERYFQPHGAGTFELAAEIRRLVTFAPLNLAEKVYPSLATNTSAMDVILCRNVIMYFTPEVQRETVSRLQAALVDGGWLGLSAAEGSPNLLRPLEPVRFPGAMLFRKTGAGVAPVAPTPRLPARPQAPVPPRRRPSRSIAPRSVESTLELARSEADRGSLDVAVDLCRDAIRRDRLDPNAHVLLAEIEQERGEVAAALEAIRSAIYLAPQSPAAHFIRGTLLFREGRTSAARASMQTVVALLRPLPPDQLIEGADGLPAARLLETAAAYTEA